MYSDIINLIEITQGKDSDGFPINVEVKHEVYADKKSVTRSEFYSSMQAGIKATALFETRLCDYEEPGSPTILEHEGKRYKVERTYTKDNEKVELTCSDLGA